MSGEELKKKLDAIDMSQTKMAELMGVFPQSFNKTLQADDVKSGFIEKLCRVLNKDISFFYGENHDAPGVDEKEKEISDLKQQIEDLKEQNRQLKEDLFRACDSEQPMKDSKVFKLWMKFMEITCEWQGMYKKEKGK